MQGLVKKQSVFNQNRTRLDFLITNLVVSLEFELICKDFRCGVVKSEIKLLNCINENLSIQKIEREMLSILVGWRSFLPTWSTQRNYVYPSEFKKLMFVCCCIFHRLNKTINARISKDVRMTLLKNVATDWKKEKVQFL